MRKLLSLFVILFGLLSCSSEDNSYQSNANDPGVNKAFAYEDPEWQAYGKVYLNNEENDSIYFGEPYSLHFISGDPIHIYFDGSIDLVEQIGPDSYHIQSDGLVDIYIEDFYEDEETVSLLYKSTSSILDEYNMKDFDSFKLIKFPFLGDVNEDKYEAKFNPVFRFIMEYLLAREIDKILDGDGNENEKETAKEACARLAKETCGEGYVKRAYISVTKCYIDCYPKYSPK